VSHSGNETIAQGLREMSDLLELQEDDGFRVAAYRRASRTVKDLGRPIDAIVRNDGLNGVMQLPGIGRGIGAAIVEMVNTGRWSQLDRLTGTLEPEKVFQTIPGIGPGLARRIHDELHVDTLEQLELAAHDGRLERVRAIGRRRALAIAAALSARLGHRRVRSSERSVIPPIDILLDVDRDYRTKAAQGSLPNIAPKRFNPSGEAWLPVLHARRGDWLFTVLFSNTQRAHDLAKTRDWVIIYFHTEQGPELQCTVVTETGGSLKRQRVVRGREGECIAHYAAVQQLQAS
jgi:DNA polymerase (family X)